MTNEQRDAVTKVVHYLRDEERHYRESSAGQRRNHIYRSVLVLEGLLAEQKRVERA